MRLVDLLVNLALGGEVWISAPAAWAQGVVGCARAMVEVLAAAG